MTYRTVIFDLDGTLLNTLSDLTDSTNYALLKNGLPPRTADEVRMCIGGSIDAHIKKAVPAGTSPELTAQCLADCNAHYQIHMHDKTAPFPGILELLSRLKEAGRYIAVVSNKPDGPVHALCRHYFGDRLPVAVGVVPGLLKKPAPDLLEKCLEEMGVERSDIVYIGDSEFDIQTAANASLPCISVSWGYRERSFLKEQGATVIVDTAEELLDLLLNG